MKMSPQTQKEDIQISVQEENESSISFTIPKFNIEHQFYWLKDKKVLIDIMQKISDITINQAYQLAPELFLNAKLDDKAFKIYRPNHDVTHAMRQFFYAQRLLITIQESGPERWKNVTLKLTQEETAILTLASFCLRIGRLNEDSDKSGSKHKLYSARLFEYIANQLGFSVELVNNVRDAMYCKKPKLRETERYNGFSGISEELKLDKAKFFREVFYLSHHVDLVRCWGSKGEHKFNAIYEPILKHLLYLLEDKDQSESSTISLMNYAANACIATGNKVYLISPEHKLHFDEKYRKGLKARCVKDVGHCFKKLHSLTV